MIILNVKNYLNKIVFTCFNAINKTLYRDEKVVSLFLVFMNSANLTPTHEAKIRGTCVWKIHLRSS